MADMWAEGGAYEMFMGRWSRLVAPRFLAWLDLPGGLRWADLGCGTGALTATILERADPASVLGVEPSAGFLAAARKNVTDPRATFRHGSTEALAGQDLDVVVAGLVLNFLPDVETALTDFAQAAPGGTVAAYVWDYQDGNQMLVRFWRAATKVAGHPVTAAENASFASFQPAGLIDTWERGGDGGAGDRDGVRGLRRLLVALPRRPGARSVVRRDAGRARARVGARDAARGPASRHRRANPADRPGVGRAG
jgi:SAM-dependent methyltransferase